MSETKDTKKNSMKPLMELTLLDRFLFAHTMEDRESLQLMLSIMLEEDILLAPGEIDFNNMRPSYLITIMSFDLWRQGLYKYTFKMRCQEEEGIFLEDGSTRIFLNTQGTKADRVSSELIELLHYMEETSDEAASGSRSARIKELHRRVSEIKSSEEIGMKYIWKTERRKTRFWISWNEDFP